MSLRYVILSLLSVEPNTGYGIGRVLRGELSHVWEARLQQIYTELAKLEAEGALAVEELALPKRPAKKLYRLTPEGEAALTSWLSSKLSRPSARDDLLVRLSRLGRLEIEAAVRLLEERSEEATTQIVALQRRLPGSTPITLDELGRLMTLEAALARADAEVAWCSRALDRLRAIERGGAGFAGDGERLTSNA